MINRMNKAALLTGTVMAGAMIASPAMAQGTPDEPSIEATQDADVEANEEGLIVVTGSRIARRDLETAAPVAVVNSEEFELSGTVNVENVINTLPQVVPGTTSFSNNPGNGTASLNLRGLGAARTLVLVNGRRWMFYDTNQIVDLNTIPQFLLESVDVVTGGASAVYGSDAIAGVVNFRLKDVQGVELGGQYSITERGDGMRYEVHGAIGSEFADGRGSATVYAEYYNRDSIFQGDREFSNFALGGELDGVGYQIVQDLADPHRVSDQVLLGPLAERDGETDPLFPGRRAVERFHGSRDIGEIETGGLDLQLAGFDLRQIQHIIDQAQQQPAGPRQGFGLTLVCFEDVGLFQCLRHAEHRIHGRADFVAHAGQEIRLGAIGSVGALTRPVERASGAFQLVLEDGRSDADAECQDDEDDGCPAYLVVGNIALERVLDQTAWAAN